MYWACCCEDTFFGGFHFGVCPGQYVVAYPFEISVLLIVSFGVGVVVSGLLYVRIPRMRPYFSVLSLIECRVSSVPGGSSSLRYVLATRPSGVFVSGLLIPARRIGVLCMTMLNPRSMSSRMVSPSVTDTTVALYSYMCLSPLLVGGGLLCGAPDCFAHWPSAFGIFC